MTSGSITQGVSRAVLMDDSIIIGVIPFPLEPSDCGYDQTLAMASAGSQSMPSFVTFDPSTNLITVDLATAQVGTFVFTITSKLVSPQLPAPQASMQWSLQIFKAPSIEASTRTPPYFTSPLSPLIVGLDQVINYKFPQYADNDTGDFVSLTVEISEGLSSFLALTSASTLRASPTRGSQLGIHFVPVTLKDSTLLSQQYQLIVDVQAKPVIVVD